MDPDFDYDSINLMWEFLKIIRCNGSGSSCDGGIKIRDAHRTFETLKLSKMEVERAPTKRQVPNNLQ